MDVRCERCKTEYEFDDARITEAGVTVKCTSCGHVFKVKKKALVVTVPVKPDEAGDAVPAAAPPAAQTPTAAREWKVRQANGNVFTFKELTTLQKWIVERKVSRDDEISLTGETWKRLGNIAELASFFQVVEEAQKAAQLQALQAQQPTPTVAPPAAAPPPVVATPPVASPPVAAPSPAVAPSLESAPAPTPAAPSRPVGNEPRFVAEPMALDARHPTSDDLEAAGLKKKSGGAGKWLGFLVLLVALGGGAYYGYFYWYLPQHPELQNLLPFGPVSFLGSSAPAAPGAPPPALPVVDAGTQEARASAAAVPDAGTPDAGQQQAAAVEQDAGPAVVAEETAAPEDAGVVDAADAGVVPAEGDEPGETKPAEAKVDHRPRQDFDYWLAQGDRLRMHERAEAALEAYGKAADLGPSRAEPVAGRGLAFLDLGQKPQAEAAFREALKLNPRYAVAVMGLAETYRAMGRNKDAVDYYQKYLEILPDGPEAPVAKAAIDRLKE